MIRNLKLLGLAIVAVLAMSGVAASAASADFLTSEKYPVDMTGKGSGVNPLTIVTTAGTVKCKEASYTGAVGGATSTVTVTPNFPVKTVGGEQNCTGFGFPAEVNTNGCTYTYQLGGATTGGMVINCAAGKEITVTAASAGVTKCIAHFSSQTLSSGLSCSNTGTGTTREVDVSVNIVNLVVYKHTPGTGVGACTNGSGSGSYTGSSVLTGEGHVGIFVS